MNGERRETFGAARVTTAEPSLEWKALRSSDWGDWNRGDVL